MSPNFEKSVLLLNCAVKLGISPDRITRGVDGRCYYWLRLDRRADIEIHADGNLVATTLVHGGTPDIWAFQSDEIQETLDEIKAFLVGEA